MVLVASKVSKYREFYADAVASATVQNPSDYEVVLRQMTGKEANTSGDFHPSSEDRLRQLLADYTLLRRGRFWKWYLAATLSHSMASVVDGAPIYPKNLELIWSDSPLAR